MNHPGSPIPPQPSSDGVPSNIPDLTGAVDLASPIQQAGRAFLQALATQGGVAAVLAGRTASGQLLATHATQYGLEQVFGLSILAALTIWHQNEHRQQVPAPVDNPQA